MSQKKETEVVNIQTFQLKTGMELRFEVEEKTKVTLELKSGFAEIFGTEMVRNRKYVFSSNAKIAVFTWHSCTVELCGKPEIAYVSTDTPMVMYCNIHRALEQMRQRAEEEQSKGPSVLIVGPNNVGKSTLCRILLNYAVRLGRRPTFVDLDVGDGEICIPGSLGALLVERTADIEGGFSQEAALVYHYGHESAGNNIVLYNALVSRIGEVVNMRAVNNRRTQVSGTIINTCGWVKGESYEAISHAVSALDVDVVLVIDQEKLYNQLVNNVPSFVKVVSIPKSGGVVDRCESVRAKSRIMHVREYFYGSNTPLFPHSFYVPFSDVKVYKIGAPSLPDSCMPLGMKAEDNRTKLVPVPIGMNLLHRVLGVSFVTGVEEDIIRTNVVGFIGVTGVDMEKQVLTVLSPQPHPLPKSVLLMSDIEFMDAYW